INRICAGRQAIATQTQTLTPTHTRTERPIRQSENERRERSNTESIWIVSGLTRNKFRIIRIYAGRQAIATQTQTKTQTHTRTERPMSWSATPVCALRAFG